MLSCCCPIVHLYPDPSSVDDELGSGKTSRLAMFQCLAQERHSARIIGSADCLGLSGINVGAEVLKSRLRAQGRSDEATRALIGLIIHSAAGMHSKA